ncbi:DJ-1/PfpI family protein [Streptomyces sp. NPDC058953]|uniref:DJ-1/PfpI family protein n=1 Tax=unclassified Streptomyces TaxID=2593676 RepID=UPI003673DE1D
MTTTPTPRAAASRRALIRTTAAAGAALATGAAAAPRASAAEHPRTRKAPGPRVGVVLYDGYSLLDPTGPAEVLSRLPGAEVTMIAARRGPVRTDTGDVRVMAERALAEVDRLDVLVVPGAGNRGTVAAMNDRELLAWIRRIHRTSRFTTSVCTGSLVLAAAGLLDGREATTYWASAPYLEASFDVTYRPERYVRSGRIITAAGVSAGLDMSLYLASLIAGDTTAEAIQLALDYDPRPPFDTGNAAEADDRLKALALRLLEESQDPGA